MRLALAAAIVLLVVLGVIIGGILRREGRRPQVVEADPAAERTPARSVGSEGVGEKATHHTAEQDWPTEAKPPLAKEAPQADRIATASPPQPEPTGASGPGEGESVAVGRDAPRPVMETAYQDFAPDERYPTRTDLSRWIEPHRGQVNFFRKDNGQVQVTGFEGLFRLVPRWEPDTVLRLSLFEMDRFRIYFWAGGDGVAIRYWQDQRRWAAYRATRQGEAPSPSTLELAGIDDDLYMRSGEGTFEIRHHEGLIVMTRGSLRLLAAPMKVAPTAVFFDGRALVAGLSLYRGGPPPPDEPDARRPFLVVGEPAKADLESELPEGARIERAEDGALELIAKDTKAHAASGITLPAEGLHEFTFLVEAAAPGTGVYIAALKDKPLLRAGFFRDSKTQKTIFGFLQPWEDRLDGSVDANREPLPYSLERQWLRLTYGCGVLKLGTSFDGVRWSRFPESMRVETPAAATRAGVYALKGGGQRSIRLRRIEVRELAAVAALAPEALSIQVKLPAHLKEMNLKRWLLAADESRPSDVDIEAWRRAWAVRTISVFCSPQLGNALLLWLADAGLCEKASQEARLRLLEEAATLAADDDYSEARALAGRLVAAHVRIGRSLEDSRAFSALESALLKMPIRTYGDLNFLPEPLIRSEVVRTLYEKRWLDLEAVCRRVGFWNRPSRPDAAQQGERPRLQSLLDWAERAAGRHLSRGEGPAPRLAVSSFSHPLVEELSKEAYNVLAEFEAAVQGGSNRDACEILAGMKPESSQGLVPDPADPDLLVSLPAAVEATLQRHPALAQTLRDEYGAKAKLRVRRAVAENDVAALAAATFQFRGTEAARDAHVWLGDRLLAAGDFAQALREYEEALAGPFEVGSAPEREAVEAKRRVSAAFVGRDLAVPAGAVGTVEFGGLRLSAGDVEGLVREILARHSGAGAGARSPASPEAEGTPVPGAARRSPGTGGPAEAPRPFRPRRLAHFEDDTDQRPRSLPEETCDWLSRLLAACPAGDVLLVTNRFRSCAFSISDGGVRWNQPISTRKEKPWRWPLEPMRPVPRGGSAVMRTLAHHGPELTCLDTATGRVLWQSCPGDHVASDPLSINGELFVLCVSVQGEMLVLQLASLDEKTGAVVSRRPLLKFHDAWERELPCQAVVSGDRIVATAGGTIFSCDSLGKVLWVHRDVLLWPSVDPDWFHQIQQPPIVEGGRVFASPTGVRALIALDSRSGRCLWKAPSANLRKVVGVARGSVIALDSEGLQAFAEGDGESVWQVDAAGVADACLAGESELLYISRDASPLRVRASMAVPQIVALEPSSGAEISRRALDDLSDEKPLLGPLIAASGKVWLFYGRAGKEGSKAREIYELR